MGKVQKKPAKKTPKELPYNDKLNVMKKLLPVADKLFEKWTIGLDRATQHATWSSIAEQCELDGIPVGNGLQLKNCVRNWINRAQKVEGALKSNTGDRENKLTHLQALCIDVHRSAKGSVSGEAISSKRNGDESDVNNSKVMTTQKSPESLSVNEESFDAAKIQEQYHDNADRHGPQFEDYRNESKLRQYKLLLQSIELERKLNLNHQEIFSLRESISHSLTDLPSSASIDIEKMAFEYVE